MKKVAFYTIWLAFISLSVFTLFKVTPLSFALSTPARLTNFIQRGLALILFVMLFNQIIIGAFMEKISDIFGNWIFKFHVFEGVVIYTLALLHPTFYVFTNYFLGQKLDFYVAFVNACLLCKTPALYYQTIGIISFWLLTLAVFAARFRKMNSWMKKHWRQFHVLNYIIFLAIGIHGFFLGTDFRAQPFFTFAMITYLIILGIVIFIEIPRLYKYISTLYR